jgi:hypothetical protein
VANFFRTFIVEAEPLLDVLGRDGQVDAPRTVEEVRRVEARDDHVRSPSTSRTCPPSRDDSEDWPRTALARYAGVVVGVLAAERARASDHHVHVGLVLHGDDLA